MPWQLSRLNTVELRGNVWEVTDGDNLDVFVRHASPTIDDVAKVLKLAGLIGRRASYNDLALEDQDGSTLYVVEVKGGIRKPLYALTKREATASIVGLIEEVNRKNRESTCVPEVRQGWNSMLESILMRNGVYSGFGYLEQKDVPEGLLPGIVPGFNDAGERDGSKNKFPDETRRFYYVHNFLQRKDTDESSTTRRAKPLGE